ncbi:MAG: S-layer-like protein array protein [Candidatus Kaiserbacteria bacterium GW2011_GWA2_49_19]|uniref:S-layer-like protein array protein n=1 Tax=Candidatus Kaiserbacteria bacterium GW2011_GWA2_49_19 TaxID=1618669 RepID=A0A0G1XZJ0_9BACT|nr:MAG: S-layer-like protein array protein [Candidatus Kaiserbacteria bacterium GW2011_GWA2_49_19]
MADLQSIRVQRIWGIAVSVFFLFLPIATSAQVVISEIMYDAPGLEGSGEHDWIEVFNAGASAVDISAYRFFEAGTNHTLKLESGSATLPSVGYAIIASATSTFLADWPAFSGTLFDSSFNLNSAGELIGIRVDTSDTTHDFTYVPSDAATNNGSSLHRASATAATFSAGTPSPGTGSLTVTGSSSGNLNRTREKTEKR